MSEATQSRVDEIRARQAAMTAAHERANRDALLEHARMGRPVCEWRDGQVVWLPPVEVFARYGFDEFGRPLPTEPA